MRITSFALAGLLCLGLVLSCKKNTPDSSNIPVVIQRLTLQQQNGSDCNLADTLARMDCASLVLYWPDVQQGNDSLKRNVARWTDHYLSGILYSSPDSAATGMPVENAVQAFFEEHRSTEKSVMTGAWVAESDFRVLLNDGIYLTLEINGYTYQGGAHGSPTAAVATFDIRTGKQLSWDDLVTDKTAFQTVAEQQFRETRSDIFQPTDGNEPFAFDATAPFALAQNYGLVPEGIYLHYVPYEVGPYAIGSTQVIVPYGQTGGLNKIKTAAAILVNAREPKRATPPPAIQAVAKGAEKTVKTSGSKKTASAKSPAQPVAKTVSKPKSTATTAPAVTLKQNGDMLLDGKTVGDPEDLRKQLQAHLLTYAVIPEKIPFNTVGQTGMGMRAEINDIIRESIAGAKWLRKKSAIAALNTVVGKKLAMSTQLEPTTYHTSGAFAYLSAQPRRTDGAPIDFGRTAYAKDQSAAWFENNVVGLLYYEKGAWKVLSYTIGVREAPGSTWAKQYKAPAGLFGK